MRNCLTLRLIVFIFVLWVHGDTGLLSPKDRVPRFEWRGPPVVLAEFAIRVSFFNSSDFTRVQLPGAS